MKLYSPKNLSTLPMIVLGIVCPLLADCRTPGTDHRFPPPEFEAPQDCSEFDDDRISKLDFAAKYGEPLSRDIRVFLHTSAKLWRATVRLELDMVDACKKLGASLGMSNGEMSALSSGDGQAAELVCAAVFQKAGKVPHIGESGRLMVNIEAPVCHVEIEAMLRCYDECGFPVAGKLLPTQCKGGEIGGRCEGRCLGICSAAAGAQCHGICRGTCTGWCSGEFSGSCQSCTGRCGDKPAEEADCPDVCVGKCASKGIGRCGDTCYGDCSGPCVNIVTPCEGRCSGGCSVDLKEPTCSGRFEPSGVSAYCLAICGAMSAASTSCDLSAVNTTIGGYVGLSETMSALLIEASISRIVQVQFGRGKRMVAALNTLATTGTALKNSVLRVDSSHDKANACIDVAMERIVRASMSVTVSTSGSAVSPRRGPS